MSNQVLVKTLGGEQSFLNFKDFTRVLVLDENDSSAKVYVEGRLIGTIYDSDIDRVRAARKEIFEPTNELFGEKIQRVDRRKLEFACPPRTNKKPLSGTRSVWFHT